MSRASTSLVRSLWASSHPGPTLVVTVLSAALGIAVGLPTGRLGLLVLAVLAGQLSVGISNDAFDAQRDRAVGRDDKPLARGELSLRTAWTAAFSCLAAAALLSAPLGPGLLIAHLVALASAWAYNARLKATAASIVPFILSFGLFPSFATLSASDPQVAGLWAWIAGGALGAAIHLTNVLPDLDDDARTGIRGFPHRIGPRASTAAAGLAVTCGAVAATLGPAGWTLEGVSVVQGVFFAAVLVVVTLTLVTARAGSSGRNLFRLVMLAALLLAAQLVAASNPMA